MLPRVLWIAKLHPAKHVADRRERWHEHWNRERITLVVMGLICFYITYVSYRNLKSFLPEAMGLKKYDRPLHLLDQALFFGNEPALVLHDVLGTGIIAHFLSTIYLWFLPMVPLVLTAWLIWSRNITYGYWFATSQCLAWSLGTASYYALPTTRPGLRVLLALPRPRQHRRHTADGRALQRTRRRAVGRHRRTASSRWPVSRACTVAITLLVALMAQYTIKARWVHWVLWVNFAITIVATLYFGWHYVADDIAGIAIALHLVLPRRHRLGAEVRPARPAPATRRPPPRTVAGRRRDGR